MSDSSEQVYLAVDLGAESGRVLAGRLGPGGVTLTEIHRFSNGAVQTASGLRWDFTKLWEEIQRGLKLAAKQWGEHIVSIGVDTWGVDYGFIGADGRLIEEPHHYRDSRSEGMQEQAFSKASRRDIYEITGIQFLPFNTIYQLLADVHAGSSAYRDAKHMLMIPDLINYRLTGRVCNEVTNASTSQLLDARTRRWSEPLIKQLGIRADLFCDLVSSGETIGTITPELAKQTGLSPGVSVVAIGSHDTASAVAGVPGVGDGWAYLSSGTWSLLGVELQEPVIDDASYGHDFTNEAGVINSVRLLKNIGGLWLLQECRRQWDREGQSYTYADLTRMAEQAPAFARVIDPDDPSFAAPGDMPSRINAYLEASGQSQCDDPAIVARTILESLALRYRKVLNTLEALAGSKINTLHIVGGGTQNHLLNQFTANATGRRVVAGPIEATALGNLLVQMIAQKQIQDLAAGRAMIGMGKDIETFMPADTEAWSAHARAQSA